jgi:hypothetical protein
MGLTKIFSGAEDLALSLQQKIETVGVNTLLKSNNQSAKIIGSRKTDSVKELFIQEGDYGKVHDVIEEFRLNL